MKINDIQPFLLEGIKFGQKEISDILSRSDDFNVGIEYEFRPTEEQKDNLEDWLKEYNVRKSITNIVAEHDNMLEFVTEKMDVETAINHLSNMFKLISDKEIEVPSMAGLHISISTNKYNLEDINMSKFLVLMNAEYLHGLFPERSHTKSIADILLKNVNVEFDKFTKEVVKDIEEEIEMYMTEKNQTIKISDYTTVDMSGRIELRFFGGKDYHKQFGTIKQELLRALFILEITYTDLHQKQYYRELYDLILSSEKKLIKQVMDNPESISDIKNPSEKVQLAAVKENARVIQYIDNPSEEVQLAAVRHNGSVIKYIDNPSEEVKIAAVKQNPVAIQFIENPTKKVQLAAVEQDGFVIKWISNPSEDVQLAAVKKYGNSIQYIDNPSEEMQLAAVKKDGLLIHYIIDKGIEPSEGVQLAAVKQNGYAIKSILDTGIEPSEEVQLAAVNQNELSISIIIKKGIEPSEKVQLAVINKDVYSIVNIKNPSEKIQLAAIKKDRFAIEYINNPSEKAKALHKELWES